MTTTSDPGRFVLTDGGLETTLIFHEGQDLPEFAAFHLLNDPQGRALLGTYYRSYLDLAVSFRKSFILESPTWRANPDWGAKIGYDTEALAALNRLAISELQGLKEAYIKRLPQLFISGCLGPRGDGYRPSLRMSAKEAEDYHSFQIRLFAECEVDMVTAMTLNYTEEAIGIVRAADQAGIRPVISFTVETDGRLATGESLRHAIETTDAETEARAAYFMVNCAHPIHIEKAFGEEGEWRGRVEGLRCNASSLSHAELDACEHLDAGNPEELAAQMHRLRAVLPALKVFGGCCGTDGRHIEAIAKLFEDAE